MERISQQTIDDIINATDIVDVIGEYVNLEPAGKSFKGLCPFHNEKTPSFFVNKEKHIFNCFGCGEKGNAASFLMKYRNLSYVDALKTLADRYNVPLEIEVKSTVNDKTNRLYEINETASEYYNLALTHLESGKPVLDYLRNRGLDIHTLQYFEIGFSPNEMDVLYKNLKTKYQELDLLELGLIKKNAEGNYYDLFRNRIIFPIRNANGKIVGFSGRLYQNIENEPKYVNSPFTSIFTKGEILYNLDRAQPAIKQMKRVVLYEGFMDVIASVRAGIKEAIASMGTALTIEQARLIKRFTENVIVCYDGDSAGFEAMQKAIKILEKEDLIVNLIILPENLDPDEYIKKYSGEQYRLYIEQNLIDPFEFRYQYLKKHADLKKTGGIERFKLAVFELLSNTSATVTELYLRKLSQDTLVDFLTIRTDFRDNQLSKAIQKTHSETKKRVTEIAIPHKYYKAEINLLHYYLESHEFRTTIQAELAGIFCYDKLNANILLNIDDLLEVNPDNSNLKDELINRYKGEEQLRVKKVLLHEGEFSNKELEDCINQMKERMLESEIKKLNDELGTLDKNMESVKYNELTNKKLSLHKRKENLWTKTKSLKK